MTTDPAPAVSSRPISRITPNPDGLPHVLYFDGSCPVNPGPMCCGYVIEQIVTAGDLKISDRAPVAEVGVALPDGTNNLAEYHALLHGLRHCHRLGIRRLDVIGDSLLIVNQVRGVWKAKKPALRRLCEEARKLMSLFHTAEIRHVPREENLADAVSRTPTPAADFGYAPAGYRGYTDRQAALMQLWFAKNLMRSGSFLARIFGGSDGAAWNAASRTTYRHITEADL